ncbi:MAG: HigA family addiction module antidote protein [Victivallales bacterium]|nr:HigA family addiction module antidote protein [Victivallales bacterium]
MSKYKPFVTLGPGDTIKEELEFYGWDQKDLADVMGISAKHVSDLINNKAPVSFDTACKLSKIFKQSPQFWINLDTQYRLRLQESAEEDTTAAKALLYRYMPIREMRKRNILPEAISDLAAAVKSFWKINKLDFSFIDKKAEALFRKADCYSQYNVYFAITWLRLCEIEAEKRKKVTAYNPEKLRLIIDDICRFTVKENGIAGFISALSECGVIFIYLPHFEKTYIDGAVFSQNENPVLVYTGRHNRNDNFWFTIAHELGHIILHKDHNQFIDNLDEVDSTDQMELEADKFARRILKLDEISRFFMNIKNPGLQKISQCSEFLEINKAIIVGSLQHNKKLSYKTTLNKLKNSVRDKLENL